MLYRRSPTRDPMPLIKGCECCRLHGSDLLYSWQFFLSASDETQWNGHGENFKQKVCIVSL